MSTENTALSDALVLESECSTWNKNDTVWMLSLYGTAIGAGVLFLPISAGAYGFFPLLIMAFLAFPMTHYAHRALCRFVLSGASNDHDITHVVVQHFGPRAGKLLTLLYFFSIYPIVLMYSVALTNTSNSFLVHQLDVRPPPRYFLAVLLILALMSVVRLGEEMIVKAMSFLVYPFALILLFLSFYLIPHWNTSVFYTQGSHAGGSGFFMTLWLLIPVMVFSFNHAPIISSFALKQKREYGALAEQKSTLILKYSHLLMVSSVLFFVFSCVLSLRPEDLLAAKGQNISILSYLANHFQTPLLAYFAPLVAFVAISKSFLGHYLGAKEGLASLVDHSLEAKGWTCSKKSLRFGIECFILLSCWLVASLNPSILKMIETLGGPVIAMILFLMPMYAISRVPALSAYRYKLSNVFITIIGCISISAIVYGLIH